MTSIPIAHVDWSTMLRLKRSFTRREAKELVSFSGTNTPAHLFLLKVRILPSTINPLCKYTTKYTRSFRLVDNESLVFFFDFTNIIINFLFCFSVSLSFL